MNPPATDQEYRLIKRGVPTGEWVIYLSNKEVFKTYSQALAQRQYTRLRSGTVSIHSSLND